MPEPTATSECVLFVEDSEDLRAMFIELVDFALNRRCIGVGSYEELVALGDRALGCGVAVLDINLGPSPWSGVDAYTWLREKGYTGRIVFLTGHADNHPLVVAAKRKGDAEIVSKPIDPDRLQSVIVG